LTDTGDLNERTRRSLWLISSAVFVSLVIGASIYTAFTRSGPLPPITRGLVASWAFHSNLGVRAGDSVGGHDGLIHNPIWVTGKGYLALNFDGKSTYIEIPPSEVIQNTLLQGSFTIAAWVNSESRQRQVLVQVTNPGGDLRLAPVSFYAPWGEGRMGLVLSDGTRRVGFLSDEPIPSSRWCHVAVTFDNETGQICFYIDGESAGERSTTVRPSTAPREDHGSGEETIAEKGPSVADSGSILVGAARSGLEEMFHFQGQLDSVSLYSRVLAPQEVEALVQEAS
jgi:hypothetical protein